MNGPLSRFLTVVSVMGLWCPSSGEAQSITPDRPGIGSGATVLAPGLIHVETGASVAGGTGSKAYSIGELVVRIGAPGVEVEVFGNSFVSSPGDTGLQDFGLGVKVPVLRDVGDRMNLSLQGIVTAPTGSDAFTNGEWVGGLNLLSDIGLSDGVGLSINAGVAEAGGGAGETFTLIVTPGVSLTDVVSAYAGWAGFFADTGHVNFGEGGLTFLMNDDAQLDVNGGWALDAEGWFFGAGVAIRWGNR